MKRQINNGSNSRHNIPIMLSGCTNWKKKYEALNVEHQNLKGCSKGSEQRRGNWRTSGERPAGYTGFAETDSGEEESAGDRRVSGGIRREL